MQSVGSHARLWKSGHRWDGAHGHKGGALGIKLPLSTGVGGSSTWQG